MHDVITVGSAVYDVFLLSKQFQLLRSARFESGVGECVSLGSKIDVDEKTESTGGGATNAAVTFARLGFDAAAVCRVGDDVYGGAILADLERAGVDASFVRRVRGGETGFSALLTAENGERSALTYRGVSADFTKADVPRAALRAPWFYVTSLAGNLDVFAKIAKEAAKTGGKIAWNPGGKELTQGPDAIRPLLTHVAVLMVNREEAAKLTGERDPAAAWRALGAGDHLTFIVTDGDKGAYAFRHDGAWFSGTTGSPSVSRTGAGDAFGSGVTAALMKGLPLPDALQIGTLNAESVIRHVGAKTGILKAWPSKTARAAVPVKPL